MPWTFPSQRQVPSRPGYTGGSWTRPTPPPPPPKDTLGDNLTGSQRDAYAAIQDMLKQYGLDTLAPKILQFVRNGYASDTIAYELQQTSEWKKRFAANETRVKKGLPVLSPQEYIATERAYRQIMSQAGVPAGFYDSTNDFQKFLENDLSPQEIQNRVQAATDFVNRKDPKELAAMRKFYTSGDLIAYALDPNRAAPLVGKAFQAASIAGQASAQGINDVDKALAESLAGNNISREQAQQGFSLIASEKGNANKLAQISGEGGFTTADLAAETFTASSQVAERRKKLASQERGRFSGASGVGKGSLSKNSGGL